MCPFVFVSAWRVVRVRCAAEGAFSRDGSFGWTWSGASLDLISTTGSGSDVAHLGTLDLSLGVETAAIVTVAEVCVGPVLVLCWSCVGLVPPCLRGADGAVYAYIA